MKKNLQEAQESWENEKRTKNNQIRSLKNDTLRPKLHWKTKTRKKNLNIEII